MNAGIPLQNTGTELDLDPLTLSPSTRSLVPLSPEALLRHSHVWGQGLMALVFSRATPPGLLAPALALLLQVNMNQMVLLISVRMCCMCGVKD